MSRLKPQVISKTTLEYDGREVAIEVWRVNGTFARQELKNANVGNRSMKRHQVEQIMHDIQRGHWVTLTGEALTYDEEGRLTNGQNRLQAIADSGETVDVVVWRNLAPEVKFVVDQGVARSGADILHFAGQEKYAALLSTALRIVASWEAGFLEHSGIKSSRYRPWSKTDLLLMAQKHPDLIKSVEWAAANARTETCRPIPTAALAFLHYETWLIARRPAKEFWDGYANDEFERVKGDPRYEMWKRVQKVHEEKAHNKVTGIYAFLGFRAWNLWREGLEAGNMLYFTKRTTVDDRGRRVTSEQFYPIPEPH